MAKQNSDLSAEKAANSEMEQKIENLRKELGKTVQSPQAAAWNSDAFSGAFAQSGDVFGQASAFPANQNGFGSPTNQDAFGAPANDFAAFGQSDAFGKADAFGQSDNFGFGQTGFGDKPTAFSPPADAGFGAASKNIVKYVASYQFDARNADELSFGEGTGRIIFLT